MRIGIAEVENDVGVLRNPGGTDGRGSVVTNGSWLPAKERNDLA
ncbi:MAG: hypothetical protein M2R45_01471 [Verrucomicrobia subdivision 3 bacterium]|nr:hypothetical protein [Limisphaerales bacterium]MCS1413399.1 hypothetical protein [Limisphaerales bacterium]